MRGRARRERVTLVLGKGGMGRRELDGNCDGEEVLYNPVSPYPILSVCGCVYFGRASYYSSCVLIRCAHN